MSTVATGRRLQRLLHATLEAQGFLVESAPNVVRWVPVKSKDAVAGYPEDRPERRLRPISTRHDFFGLWDFCCVSKEPVGPRFFVQCTTWDGLRGRRAKILAAAFPRSVADMICAYHGGRGAHWTVHRGPLFLTESAERWEVVRQR